MNISRHSIEFSLILHCLLLAIGTAWLVAFPRASSAESPANSELIKVIPIHLSGELTPSVTTALAAKPPAKHALSQKAPGADTLVGSSLARGRALKPNLKVEKPKSSTVKASIDASTAYPKARLKVKPQQPAASSSPKPRAPARRWSGTARLLEDYEIEPEEIVEPEATPSPQEHKNDLASSNTSEIGSDKDPIGARIKNSSVARPLERIQIKSPAFLALKSGYIEVKFSIDKHGASSVIVLQKTGSEEADRQVLQYLQSVKWSPKTLNGAPVDDVVTMEFSIEQ